MENREIEYVVPDGIDGERADKVFASAFEDISRARLQKAFDQGNVCFNGTIIDKRFKVSAGGVLTATVCTFHSEQPPKAVNIPLEIIFEDEDLIVINKSSGMVTHPGNGTGEDTLVHALLHHCRGRLSSIGAPDRPGIVHRLDKETSGLIVVAKTDLAHHSLVKAFSERLTKKCYQALVMGVPQLKSGSITEPIGRHSVHRTRMAVHAKGKEAHTDWKWLEGFGSEASLIECVIHTGRTHQIRVHMQHLGLPLLGDSLYGFKPHKFKHIPVNRVCLHAKSLSFQHPRTGETLSFEIPMPKDLESLIVQLREAFLN